MTSDHVDHHELNSEHHDQGDCADHGGHEEVGDCSFGGNMRELDVVRKEVGGCTQGSQMLFDLI